MELGGPTPTNDARAYGVALVAVAAAALAAGLMQPFAGLENVDLVFLVAVIAIAARFGAGPSLFACLASVAAYNFFFLPPLYTFAISNPKHVVALALFLLAAIITSNLAGMVRRRSLHALEREARTEALYAFSRRLAAPISAADIAATTAAAAGDLLGGQGAVLLAQADGSFGTQAPSIRALPLEEIELAALASAWTAPDGRPGPEVLRLGRQFFAPMRGRSGLLGVVGIAPSGEAPWIGPPGERMLRALADQTAVALERVRLAGERDAAQLAAETERLRSALLNSLSHDLKTPLASIIGAITSLRTYGPSFDEAQREDLALTIQDEAERMHRFVVNLLDMARLEAGALAPRREATDLGEIAAVALRKMEAATRDHHTVLALAPGLPAVDLDPVLLEQVLANLVENAAKFSPAGTTILIEGRLAQDGALELAVRDEGPGIAPQDRERVFDLFYQVRGGDRRPAGSGVGLAIARGFAAALGGSLRADDNPDGRGTAFVLSFPPHLHLARVLEVLP